MQMLSDAAPLISVLMVTFNEGQFIGDAIKSVLAQTIADFELIIVDDGSLDDTESIVRTFSDQRVQYVRQKNQGPPAALNTAIATARGSFIALTNGDALSHPERLARQLDAYHESGGGVIFTNAEFIDETGAVTTHAYWPRDFFLIPPMSRANIVERLFYQGNFFPTFTMFGSRQLFQEVGPSDTLLWQLSDLDLLLRLICRAEFHVMPDRLVSWRLRCGDGNLSAPTIKQQVRSNIETFLIGKNFLERLPKELFVDAFRRRFRNVESVTKIELECERAFLHAGNEHGYSRIIAVERLYALFDILSAA
jgi:glycosyltransferase involved in cell wall biosynthesis